MLFAVERHLATRPTKCPSYCRTPSGNAQNVTHRSPPGMQPCNAKLHAMLEMVPLQWQSQEFSEVGTQESSIVDIPTLLPKTAMHIKKHQN